MSSTSRSYFFTITKRASGYGRTEEGFHNAAYLSMTQPYAAGSLGSTIDDLVLWETAVREHRLVSADTQALMFTPVTLADGKMEPYGYGWAIHDYHGHPFVCHGGGINGFSTFIAQFLDEPITIVVLANCEVLDAGNRTLKIARQVLGIPSEREATSLSTTAQDRLLGQYRVDNEQPFEVVKEGDDLFLKTERMEKFLPLSETTFYMADDLDTELKFAEEKDGKFQKLTGINPLFSFTAVRVDDASID